MTGAPSVGRLVGLALITAGLAVVTLATPQAAHAARGEPPTAIAVARDGTSYVGFAGGERLLRLGPGGRRQGSVPLDEDGPVSGLAVDRQGRIWVDYGTSASLITPRGRVVERVEHRGARRCRGHAATSYGGIAVGGGRVWVANRCDDTLSVYTASGRRVAKVDLPGRGHPRGVAYGSAQAGRGASVYVALPDSGRLVAYRAAGIRDRSKPWRTVAVPRPGGGARPQPGGVAVDRYGQVTVTDMANNAVYLLDGNNAFKRYRTLGHPPRASRAAGRLNRPTALAQAPHGGRYSANLYVADSGNRRVQRWSTTGYTYWTTAVRPAAGGRGGGGGGGSDGGFTPSGPGPGPSGGSGPGPVNSGLPSVQGSAQVGAVVTCHTGAWLSGGPMDGAVSYAVAWRRAGVAIPGATGNTYLVAAGDLGTSLACVVTARNSRGATTVVSAGVVVTSGSGGGPGDPSGPEDPVDPTEPPEVRGSASVGSALTCDPGTWAGSRPSYSYRWSRDGTPITHAAAEKYVVLTADAGTSLTCTVTVTGSGAGASATSAPRTVAVPSGLAPRPVSPPIVAGTAVADETLTCDPGTWDGARSLVPVWLRDGVVVANGGWTYAVTAADAGQMLLCLVIAENASGLGAARSEPAAAEACGGAPGVDIAGGAASTTSTAVELTLRVPPGTTEVSISNDPAFADPVVMAVPVDCTVDWTMPAIRGIALTWSVHVRYDAGVPTTYSDSILVDVPS